MAEGRSTGSSAIAESSSGMGSGSVAVREACGPGTASRTGAADARRDIVWQAVASLLPQQHHREDRKPLQKSGDQRCFHNIYGQEQMTKKTQTA